jgi:hypothetical protein
MFRLRRLRGHTYSGRLRGHTCSDYGDYGDTHILSWIVRPPGKSVGKSVCPREYCPPGMLPLVSLIAASASAISFAVRQLKTTALQFATCFRSSDYGDTHFSQGRIAPPCQTCAISVCPRARLSVCPLALVKCVSPGTGKVCVPWHSWHW